MKKIISTVLAGAMLLSAAAVFASGAEETAVPLEPLKKYGVTVADGYATGIPGTPTAEELCAMFSGSVTVSYNGEALAADAAVPTGAVVSNGSSEAEVVIYGDTTYDGKVNLADASAVLKYVAKWDVAVSEKGCDVNLDGNVNLSDISMMLQKIAKWRVWLGNTGMTVSEEPQTAIAEDDSLALAFGNGIDKYLPDTEIGDAVTDVMYCAKGEIEFTQFALASEAGHKGLSVSVTPFKNAKGATLRTELYCIDFIDVNDSRATVKEVADVMSPVLTDVEIKADAIQPFGIKVYPGADADFGLYEASVSVKDADGKEIKRALVFLNVWDFVLPEASNCRSSFGLFSGSIGSSNTATVEERYKNYYDFFIENRMNPSLLPYDICSEEAAQYLNDPRVNSFLAGGEGYGGAYDTTDEQLTERYALLSQNEEWLKKAYFYYDDEPLNFEVADKSPVAEQIASIKANYEHARKLFPGAKLLIPNHYNAIDERFEGDIVGYVMKYSSILCPHMWMFSDYTKATENVWYNQEMTEKFGTLMSRVDAKLESDPEAEFWWYTSDNPRDGMCNIYITKPGIECRTLFWQQYLYGADGFLYWNISDFGVVNSRNTAITDQYAGMLCYNNKVYKTDEAVGSVRVEMVRDGIEDFDYLHMIEEKYGKDAADAFVARITTDLLEYNTDSAVLEAVRMEMGELLQGWK